MTDLEKEFDSYFWPNWPNRVAKQDALKAFIKARGKVSLETILTGILTYKENKPDWQGWLHPATFLNKERFNDEYPESTTALDSFKRTLLERSGLNPVDPGDGGAPLGEGNPGPSHIRLVPGGKRGDG